MSLALNTSDSLRQCNSAGTSTRVPFASAVGIDDREKSVCGTAVSCSKTSRPTHEHLKRENGEASALRRRLLFASSLVLEVGDAPSGDPLAARSRARGLGLPCTRGPHPSVDLRETACVYLRLTATAISAGNSRSEIFKILLDFKVRGTAPSVRLLKIERPWQGTESRPARLNRMQCVLEAQRVHVRSRKREPGLEANAAGLTSCAE